MKILLQKRSLHRINHRRNRTRKKRRNKRKRIPTTGNKSRETILKRRNLRKLPPPEFKNRKPRPCWTTLKRIGHDS